MSSKSVEKRIISVVARELSCEEGDIIVTDSFVNNLGADSLDLVELILAFEEEFGIEIPDDDAEKINTIQDAVDYVNSK